MVRRRKCTAPRTLSGLVATEEPTSNTLLLLSSSNEEGQRAVVCLILLGQCSAHCTVHQVSESEFTRVTDNFVKVCFVDQNFAVFCFTNIKSTLSKLSNLRLTGCREGHAAAEVQLRMMGLTVDLGTVGEGER